MAATVHRQSPPCAAATDPDYTGFDHTGRPRLGRPLPPRREPQHDPPAAPARGPRCRSMALAQLLGAALWAPEERPAGLEAIVRLQGLDAAAPTTPLPLRLTIQEPRRPRARGRRRARHRVRPLRRARARRPHAVARRGRRRLLLPVGATVRRAAAAMAARRVQRHRGAPRGARRGRLLVRPSPRPSPNTAAPPPPPTQISHPPSFFGSYFFSDVRVESAVAARNASGLVQPFTRKLDGGGSIEHVLNGRGAPVRATGDGSYVCETS